MFLFRDIISRCFLFKIVLVKIVPCRICYLLRFLFCRLDLFHMFLFSMFLFRIVIVQICPFNNFRFPLFRIDTVQMLPFQMLPYHNFPFHNFLFQIAGGSVSVVRLFMLYLYISICLGSLACIIFGVGLVRVLLWRKGHSPTSTVCDKLEGHRTRSKRK